MEEVKKWEFRPRVSWIFEDTHIYIKEMQRCLYTHVYNNHKVIRVYKMILQQCFEFENVSVTCPRSQIWDLADIEHLRFSDYSTFTPQFYSLEKSWLVIIWDQRGVKSKDLEKIVSYMIFLKMKIVYFHVEIPHSF